MLRGSFLRIGTRRAGKRDTGQARLQLSGHTDRFSVHAVFQAFRGPALLCNLSTAFLTVHKVDTRAMHSQWCQLTIHKSSDSFKAEMLNRGKFAGFSRFSTPR